MASVTIGQPDDRGIRVDVSFADKADAKRVLALRWSEPTACPSGIIRVHRCGKDRLSLADIAFAREAAIRVAGKILAE